MRFIYNNLAAIHVALVVSLLAWLFGGARADVLEPVVPWLLLLTAEVIVAFPQKGLMETTYEARERVWRAMKRDPFVWTAVGLLVLLAIPFLNNGLCASCDRVLIALGHNPEPPFKFLPYCVDRHDHYDVFINFAIVLVLAAAVRHSLRARGKRLMMKLVVWNGFALALLGFLQSVVGAPGPLWQPTSELWPANGFFSTFGYQNMAGSYFVALFGIAVALWRRADDEVYALYKTDPAAVKKNRYRTFCRRHTFLIPALVFFFAAINTLSRAAIVLVIALTTVYFFHTFFSLSRRMSRAERVRKGTISLAVTGLVVFFAVQTVPDDMRHEVGSLDTNEVLVRVTGKGQYHVRVAMEIWKDNFLFGCGGWGYKHFCVPKMTREELKSIQSVGGANVHNDYLQFLAEHGFIGFGLMAATILFLLAPVASTWRHLVRKMRFAKPSALPAKPVALFVLPAPAFCILMSALATFIHGFGDCPLRSAAILALFYVSLASVPGFLPHEASSEEEENYAAC